MDAKEPRPARYVSPKHLALMSDALHRVYEGTFNEHDIRALLIGVREFAAIVSDKVKQDQKAPSGIRKGMRYLADVAHSVAHPELKDRGPLREYVRNTDAQMAKALRKMASQRVISADPITKTINIAMPAAIKSLVAYDLVIAFGVAMTDIFPFEIDFAKLSARAKEIELCLFSILHFTQLPFLDGEKEARHGYLAIHSWQGRYHLYAGVLASKYEEVLSNGVTPKRDKPYVSVFPVFSGTNSSNGQIDLDARTPKIIFADRDRSGQLYLREWTSPLEIGRPNAPLNTDAPTSSAPVS